MKQLFLAIAMILLMAPLAVAAGDPCKEMEQHASEAVDHGKQGHTDALKKHAQAMLDSAKGCQKGKDHVSEAIKHQQEAVNHAGAGHGDVALGHAEEALKHAKAANKS